MQYAKKQVVILGAGYAGLMAAMRLAKKTRSSQVEITLVNAADTFNERVRNHQLAANQPLRHLPLTDFLAGTPIQFLQGKVTALQLSQRQVAVESMGGSRLVEYDYLVYTLGSFITTEAVPGVPEHAYTLDQYSAEALRQRLPNVAAQGGQLLIVGGGNTGVEVATELAETYPGLRIALVTRHSFAHNLSKKAQDYIRRAFARFGIEFLEHTAISELQQGYATTAGGRTLPFDLCIWVGGFGVSHIPQMAGIRVNERGQILIDRAMRSLSHPEIYALGDSAIPAEEPGAPIRMSLYTAIMMGAHGADCLAAHLNVKSPTAFGLSYIALGLSLGRRDGVVQFLDWDKDTPLNLIFTGQLANRTREFFVNFAVWAIKMQRTMPWVFDWPGKYKMRKVKVPTSIQDPVAPRPILSQVVAPTEQQ